MRVIHTSDWHLGHVLRGEIAREHEHAAFLGWLLDTCVAEAADVLLVTGDVFDSATPPASAERMWFELLARARTRMPRLDIVVIAGNHDSPARLGAASPVLAELGVHLITSLPRTATGAIDLERVVIPVAGGRGLVAAVPFLRPGDLPDGDDPVAAVYREVLGAARARRRGEALIVTGHLYVAGAEVEYLSERRVAVGGQEAASSRLFPDDVSYVALGHVHRAQRVTRETIRYAGAPIPLALDEASYRHQVIALDVEGEGPARIRSIPVPRVVDILRVPRRGAAPLERVLGELAELAPAQPAEAFEHRPYLEVVVALERPEPKLRALVEAALEGKRPRLVYLHAEATGDRRALGDACRAQRLTELDPREVFERLWARDHAAPPEVAVRAAFDRLLEEVRGDRADPAGREGTS
jgi:DNA repair protein SbcD/Mre11